MRRKRNFRRNQLKNRKTILLTFIKQKLSTLNCQLKKLSTKKNCQLLNNYHSFYSRIVACIQTILQNTGRVQFRFFDNDFVVTDLSADIFLIHNLSGNIENRQSRILFARQIESDTCRKIHRVRYELERKN